MSKYEELNFTLGKTERVRNNFNSDALQRLKNHIGDEVFAEEKTSNINKPLDGEVLDKEEVEYRIMLRQNSLPSCMPYVRENKEIKTYKKEANFGGLFVFAIVALVIAIMYFFMPAEFLFLKNNVLNKSYINFLPVSNLNQKPAANNPINYTPKVFAKHIKVDNNKIIYQDIYGSLVLANCDGVVTDTIFDVKTGQKTIVLKTGNITAYVFGFANISVKKGDKLEPNTILGQAGSEIIVSSGE